jgi:hypothetical protein
MPALDEKTPGAAIPPARPISAFSRDRYTATIISLQRYSIQKRSRDIYEPHQVTPLEMAIDLAERTDLAEATCSIYRSALLWYLRSEQDQSEDNRRAYWLLMTVLHERRTHPKRPAKPKTISEEDYHELVSELASMAHRSTWAALAQHFMQATLASGARPVEWLNTKWADEAHTLLEIRTAKEMLCPPGFMQGELDLEDDEDLEEDSVDDEARMEAEAEPGSPSYLPTGQTRSIPITRGSDRVAIEAHMTEFAAWVPPELPEAERLEAYTRYYGQCRQVVRRACQKIWEGEKVYSTKTMRSQFSANQKALVGAAAASILMGHSNPTSPAAAHYGKGNQAFGRFKGMRQGMGTAAEAATQADGQETGEICAPG